MSNFIYNMSVDSDFLIHHGIKGQKWGVENGPPYPLNPSKDYSKAEQKANAKSLLKEYKKNGVSYASKIVNIKDIDLSNDEKINAYINSVVGKYGDNQLNKFFDLKTYMKYDIKNQLSEIQKNVTKAQCIDTIIENGFKKDKTYDEFEKELSYINNKESYTIRINDSAFDTADVKGLQDTIIKMSKEKSFNEIYDKVKEAVTELAFSPKEKSYMYMDDDDDWNKLPDSEQKKIFKDKLGTFSFGWNDKSYSDNNNLVEVYGPNYLYFMMESGGFYGDHALAFEYDMTKNKIVHGLSLEG